MNEGLPAIGFKPMQIADLPRLRAWLHEPHVRAWWGDPDTELGYVRDMIEGRDTTLPFFICLDGEPAGYIQVWFIGHHQNATWIASHPWLAELPATTVGVDLTIGEAAWLDRGIGSHALAQFVGALRALGYGDIIIDPDPANARAVRAYEKAGFRTIPHLLGRSGDSLIMQHMGATPI
jgi:aminoglycoside 6'-N-acetyltransferase